MKNSSIILLLILLIISTGCSNLSQVDKGLVNHKAMDLKKNLTNPPNATYTVLGGTGTSSNVGCPTCAK